MFESCPAHHKHTIITCVKKFYFSHSIPFRVFGKDCDVSLKIKINEDQIFEKSFKAGHIHTEILNVDKEYKDASKNKVSFMFSGETEIEKKYLKIGQIVINNQAINKFNAEYFPKLNDEWWQGLSKAEQYEYNKIIYGNSGNQFGWYGEVNFYYYCGLNSSSMIYYNNNSKEDVDRLLDVSTNWIYKDRTSAKFYRRF